MTIRRADSGDYTGILRMCSAFRTSPYAFDRDFRELSGNKGTYPAYAEHMIRGKNSMTLVAEWNGQMIGFITVAGNPQISSVVGQGLGSILLLAVDERVRDKGIAKRLVQSGLKLLFHTGVRFVSVITDIYNIPAIHVYESFGFRLAHTWHIYRLYKELADFSRQKNLLKNIGPVSENGLDEFCSSFNRPVSLLHDRSLDTRKLRAHFAHNLKNAILKGRTRAFQFYHRNKPVGLINIMEDQLAAKTAQTDKAIFKIMDLIVPSRDENPDVERKMLLDALNRLDNYALMEYWIDASNSFSIQSAENAGFHLKYTGVAYHLRR